MSADLRLLQWVSMPHNLIFLGLHFAISKRTVSYLTSVRSRLTRFLRFRCADSVRKRFTGHVRPPQFDLIRKTLILQVSLRLNARKVLRGRTQGSSDRSEHQMPVLFPENMSRFSRARRYTMNAEDRTIPKGDMFGTHPVKSHSEHDIEPITTKVSAIIGLAAGILNHAC